MELSIDNINKFNNLFESSSKRFSPYVLIDSQNIGFVGLFVKFKIKKSIKELKECLEIVPNHINSLFLLGKCYQSLGDEKLSLQFFNQALSVDFSSLEYDEDFSKYERLITYCLLEVSVVFAKTGAIDKSIEYSEKLLNKDPENIYALCNQTMNFIINKNDFEAERLILKAITIAPQDYITNQLNTFLIKLKKGSIKRPIAWNDFVFESKTGKNIK